MVFNAISLNTMKVNFVHWRRIQPTIDKIVSTEYVFWSPFRNILYVLNRPIHIVSVVCNNQRQQQQQQ